MTDYVPRDAVLKAVEPEYRPSLGRQIMSIPAADVAPIVHGRWIWDKDGMDWGIGAWRCSICYARPETWWQGDKSNPRNKSGHYYCPNCGAKMDEEGET